MNIKEMYLAERPREKLLERGAGALSDGELLAIILRTGTAGVSAIDLAQNILTLLEGKLGKFSGMDVEKMYSIKGMGKEKVAILLASCELGRRFMEGSSYPTSNPLTSPKTVYDIMAPKLKGLAHEECWVLYLNTSQQLISKERISTGGMDSTVIDNRIILKRALALNSTNIILIHNHPGIRASPSLADIECTQQLKNACNTIGIHLLDHVIIADKCYYSFSDEVGYDE